MKRGEVYEYVVGSRLIRIAIVSASRYNPQQATYVVIHQPGGGGVRVPASIVIQTASADPVTGAIDVTRLRPLDPSAVRARVGRLTLGTLSQLSNALRTYLDL